MAGRKKTFSNLRVIQADGKHRCCIITCIDSTITNAHLCWITSSQANIFTISRLVVVGGLYRGKDKGIDKDKMGSRRFNL